MPGKLYFIVPLLQVCLSCSHISSSSNHFVGPAWPTAALRGANISSTASREDLHHFAMEWGGQGVRILQLTPMSNIPPYAINEDALNDMYRTADYALAEGLAVVFAPGVAMEDNNGFFSSLAFQSAWIDYWVRVAKHFKSDSRVIAYDLMNEPHDDLAKTHWSAYARKLTQAVREIDSVHTIIIEPPEWAWPPGFEYLQPTGDENTIYSFHSYAPNEFTTQKTSAGFLTATEKQWQERVYPGAVMEGETWNKSTMEKKLEPAFEFARKNHVRIWCGEFGVARWAKGAQLWLKDMIDIFTDHQIGWSYYSYREWQVMDLEMQPDVKNKKTERSETEFVKLLKQAYAN